MRQRKLTLINHQVSDFNRKFESKARFLVDESVGMDAVRLIQGRGWNVRYVGDVGLSGRSDEEVLAFAWEEQRILRGRAVPSQISLYLIEICFAPCSSNSAASFGHAKRGNLFEEFVCHTSSVWA